jgi:fructoselysine 6-phosphate deglycase
LQSNAKTQFINYLDRAVSLIDKAAELGRILSEKGFSKLVFVGCGAPYRVMSTITYWIEKKSTQTRCYSYYPAEFIHQDPKFIDKHTVVILGSYSGTTSEIVEAAKYCQTKPCYSIGITRLADSPLSLNVDQKLLFGDTKLGDYSRFIVTSVLVSGYFSVAEPQNWDIHEKLLSSLRNLPTALFSALEQTEKRIQEFTKEYSSHDSMFVVGAGPMFHFAYMLAFNSYMEMQWMHVTPIAAAEFFHGPFELVDESFPVINLIDETPHREEAERVKRFGEEYCRGFINFDSKDYELEGIDEDIRPFVSTIVLDAATRRLMDYFSEARGHDKSIRRYMGKVDY